MLKVDGSPKFRSSTNPTYEKFMKELIELCESVIHQRRVEGAAIPTMVLISKEKRDKKRQKENLKKMPTKISPIKRQFEKS